MKMLPGGAIEFETEAEVARYTLQELGLPATRWGAFRWLLQGGTLRAFAKMWRALNDGQADGKHRRS